MPMLRLQLLNHFQLIYDDVPVTAINQARMQALLAYLVLHRDAAVPRQHLAFLFWPDTSEAQAHTNLRQLLHHLRRAWPGVDDFVQIDPKPLQWKPTAAFELDVMTFEQTLAQAAEAMQTGQFTVARTLLGQVVDHYSGDLLPACYEEWLLAERERLHQRFLDALAQLVARCEAERDYPAA